MALTQPIQGTIPSRSDDGREQRAVDDAVAVEAEQENLRIQLEDFCGSCYLAISIKCFNSILL